MRGTGERLSMTRSPRHMLPLVPMGVALALFVAFHFLRVAKNDGETGWMIWVAIVEMLRRPEWIDPLDGIGIASFFMFSLLIVSSPFLIGVWRKSKPAWRLATVFSGLGAAGFWITVLGQGGTEDLVAGGWCLMLAPVLNFMGLLLVSRENRPDSPPESA